MHNARLIACGALAFAACARQIESDPPSLTSVTPGAACAEQRTSTLTVRGKGFTPLPISVLGGSPSLVLPSLYLGRTRDLGGAPALDGRTAVEDGVAWDDPETMRFDVAPSRNLAPGLYDLTVEEPGVPAASLAEALLVVPRPRVSAVEASLGCSDAEVSAVVIGEGFVRAASAVPKIEVGTLSLAPERMEECAPLPGRQGWERCARMAIHLAAKALPPGRHAVRVTNPDPVGCGSTDAVELTLVPEPTLARVDPEIACVEDGARVVTVRGTGFLDVAGARPVLRAGNQDLAGEVSGCVDVPGPTVPVRTCTTLTATVPARALPAGVHALAVVNPAPAACASRDRTDLVIVPEPTLATVEPDLACTAQGSTSIQISGAGLLEIDGAAPSVSIGGVVLRSAASGCALVSGTVHTTARSCTTLTASVARSALGPGTYPVSITNPDPAGCTTDQQVGFLVVPAPSLARAAPELVCREQAQRTIALAGSGFIGRPRVVFRAASGATATVATARTSSCTTLTGARTPVSSCGALEVDVPAGRLPEGALAVTVENPTPPGCATVEPVSVVAISRPAIAGLSTPAICSTAAARGLAIQGRGFVVRGGDLPAVLLSGAAGPIGFSGAAVTPGGCAPIAGAAGATTCTSLSVALPGMAAPGDYAVTVANPEGLCATTDAVTFTITEPPSVTGVMPASVCANGGALMIRGARFARSATVRYGGVPASAVNVDATGTTITAVFPELTALEPGTSYPLVVENAPGCAGSAAAPVLLTPGLFTYFADPPVVYSGIRTRVTLLTSGIAGRPLSVRLRHAATGATLDFADPMVIWDPARPARVQVDLPAATAQAPIAPGAWDAVITDSRACSSGLPSALVVTDRLSLSLASIAPPFGDVTADTPIVLTSAGTATAGLFRGSPRVYLNPVAGAASPAAEVRSVSLVDPASGASDRLTGVAPDLSAGLAVGAYDVVVVNPDGTVGLLRGAYRVTALPPPVIDTIAPGSITGAAGQTAAILGSGFRLDPACTGAAGREDTCVRLRCGRIGTTAPNLTPPTRVTAASGTSVTISIDASALSAGDACAVRVTNADGTWVDFSAITVANPSSGNNPIAFVPTPPLVTGRRAAAAVGARATSTARFVYAIGGDRGTDATALATVEAASVGLFGDLGSWFTLPVRLPAPRTRAGAVRIGRFIYLVGGHVPPADTASVLRAEVLDPADAPEMGDPDLRVVARQTGGLAAGAWSYRVSAVLDATDPANPGGETLPSDPLVVRVPASPGNQVRLRVSWRAHPRAASYLLYRSTAPGPGGGERLLCALPASQLTYEDAGETAAGCTSDTTRAPLPLGSTGTWTDLLPDAGGVRAARAMVRARASAGVGVAPDRTDPAVRHILAAGGHDGATVRGSYEHLAIRVAGPSAQAVVGAGWSAGSEGLTARTELGLVVAEPATAPRVAPDACAFALAGRTGAAATTGRAEEAMLPSSGGELGEWTSSFSGPGQSNVPGAPAGAAVALANDAIYVFGGGPTPSSAGVSRTLGNDCTAFTTPWQSLGSTNLRARYLSAIAIQSGFAYLIGGAAAAGAGTCGDGTADIAAATCSADATVLGGQP